MAEIAASSEMGCVPAGIFETISTMFGNDVVKVTQKLPLRFWRAAMDDSNATATLLPNCFCPILRREQLYALAAYKTGNCERQDLNLHPLRDWNLNPARLPVSPLSRAVKILEILMSAGAGYENHDPVAIADNSEFQCQN